MSLAATTPDPGALASDSSLVDALPTDLRGADLRDRELAGVDLSGRDLRGADLSGANLSGAKLVGCTLVEVTLVSATLDGAELLGADLSGAYAQQCSARNVGLGRACLANANFFGACLDGASMQSANLAGCDVRTSSLVGARLRDADLTAADFTSANLEHADLSDATVVQACFDESVLDYARLSDVRGFERARWFGASLREIDFRGAYAVRRFILDENYLAEFRRRSRASRVVYWLWWATSDCGRSFVRWGLWTLFVAAVFAGLYQTVSLDFGDHPTFLSTFYFSIVTLTTLGYGDVLPASVGSQLLIMAEVVLGYVMLGGLLGIFANKMAMRAG